MSRILYPPPPRPSRACSIVPYPGTELYEQERLNGWFVKKDKTDLVEGDGFQQSAPEYPGLSKEEVFESVERFYHRYYLRPKPILRIIKTMR